MTAVAFGETQGLINGYLEDLLRHHGLFLVVKPVPWDMHTRFTFTDREIGLAEYTYVLSDEQLYRHKFSEPIMTSVIEQAAHQIDRWYMENGE
jgi:hypothetical protein